MKVPDLEVKKTLYVGEGDPSVPLGKGPLQIRGRCLYLNLQQCLVKFHHFCLVM